MIQRQEFHIIRNRLLEPRRFIQVVLGPRQVGKTTTVRQALDSLETPHLYFSADGVLSDHQSWLANCWNSARVEARLQATEMILVIDEIQKISNWSEIVKREWDKDTWGKTNIKVLLLGSSRALIMAGLSESLFGRYEEIRMTHWTYPEMKEAFGFSLEQFLYFGGYPGPASEIFHDEERWKAIVRAAMIDSTINRDIFEDVRIGKPALLRKTFELGVAYSGKILSLTKLLGEIQDVGNTMTIAGYLERLDQCGLLRPLQKFSIDAARKRASMPKLQVYNNALYAALSGTSFHDIQRNPVKWGECVESAVGAYLISQAFCKNYEVLYWHDGADEVDFVLRIKGKLVALEVKSNNEKHSKGLDVFCSKFHPDLALIVGSGGLSLETFLSMDPVDLIA